MALLGAGGAAGPWYAGYSAEVQQYFARITQPSAGDITAYQVLIDGLVTDGLWAKLDALWIAGATEARSFINLKSASFPITIGVQPTFTAYQGWAGNGSTQYLKTGFFPSTAGGVFTQDSNHFGGYVRTSRASSADYFIGGCNNSTFERGLHIAPWLSDKVYFSNNDANAGTATSTNVQGHWINTRTASSTKVLYRNGASHYAPSESSTGFVDTEIYLGAFNNGGSLYGTSADQHSAWHLGSGLTSGNSTDLSARVNACETSFGVNVY